MVNLVIHYCPVCGEPMEADGSLVAREKRARWPDLQAYVAAHPGATLQDSPSRCALCVEGEELALVEIEREIETDASLRNR